MSEKNKELEFKCVFADIVLHNTFVPDQSFYESFFERATNIIVKEDYSYSRVMNKLAINKKLFPFIWNKFPKQRSNLVNRLISAREEDIPFGFKRGVSIIISSELERIFNEGTKDIYGPKFREVCAWHRINMSNVISPNFDYLQEIESLDTEKDYKVIDLWLNKGLRSSKDKRFYEFCWKSIKRSPGSSDKKMGLIDRMSSNDVSSEAILEEVAKRGTKRVKRKMVEDLSRKIADDQWNIGSIKRQHRGENIPEEYQNKIENVTKRIDKRQSELMLFVDCDDREVISSMIGSIKKEDLTWLIPAASKYPYLSSKIESIIESKNI